MIRQHKKLESLMLFSAVAERLSFSHAAQDLGVSRGYLSDRIRQLELELGTPLLIRSTRSVRLTEEGLRIQQGMERIRGDVLELERSLEQEQSGYSGLLRITAPVLFSERYLLDICRAFQDRHPGVQVELDCSYTSHNLTLENFDLAFRATATPPQNMVARPLLHYRHCCCASPAYLDIHGRPAQPADLVRHQCLLWPGLDEWPFAEGGHSVSGTLRINDHRLLKQAALQGRGIIRVAEYLVDRELRDGRLERVLPQAQSPEQSIFMIYPRLSHQSERLKGFIRFTRDYFADRSTAPA